MAMQRALTLTPFCMAIQCALTSHQKGLLTRKWTKISRPQNQNMETTKPLMIARVGQKRQSEEALKTPKVSNDGD